MGPRCSAESSKRRGILDPKIGHLASLEQEMKEDEAEEDSLGAARLLWLNTKEERTTRKEALLARAEDAVTALTDLKKGKAVLRLKEKTKALQNEEILQDDYQKILSEAEQKVMGFQLDKYGTKMLLAPAKKKSRAEKNKENAAGPKPVEVTAAVREKREATEALTAADLNAVALIMGTKVKGKVSSAQSLEVRVEFRSD